MPEDLQQLQRKIEEGLAAVRELKRLEAEQKKQERPKFRLIKGSAIGAGIWAGVEWLWSYKVTVAVAAAAVTFTGGVIADQPGSPGSDPPQVIKPPSAVRPSVRPPVPLRPKPTATQRTSPLRTQAPMRIAPPAEPVTSKPSVKPKETPSVAPSRTASPTPTVSLPVTHTVIPSVPVETTSPCAIDLLGIKICLRHGAR